MGTKSSAGGCPVYIVSSDANGGIEARASYRQGKPHGAMAGYVEQQLSLLQIAPQK